LADAARQLRGDLKVLFTTGYARNAIVHDGRLDPGVQLITKPFSYAGLAAKLRDVLDTSNSTGRILIVEDEALVQMLLADNLDAMGFSVAAASTATEALNKVRLLGGDFDAAIVDLGLPDAKGDALVKELRALYPSLPLVISSGADDTHVRNRLAKERHVAFLLKPYTGDQLRTVLAEVGVRAPQ
ncbi:MAG: response regulator, partial [Steroidobacteraceae bacterium]